MSTSRLRINGRTEAISAPADTPLLWVIRDLLALTGTKYSCGIGACKSCAVQLDGVAVPSCVIPVGDVGDREVTTIEGLHGEEARRLREAWLQEQVSQCGYCQPGQIITADALLRKTPSPTDGEIDQAMGGVLCRCGTYPRIRRAIHRAAQRR